MHELVVSSNLPRRVKFMIKIGLGIILLKSQVTLLSNLTDVGQSHDFRIITTVDILADVKH